MGLLDTVVVQQPRPLPVVVMIDISGSMLENNKIGVCNDAVREMITSLAGEEDIPGELQLAVITFGGEAKLHQALTPVRDVTWQDMTAEYKTPMGGALRLARELIEDRETVPTRSYLPTLVLISDGMPNDLNEHGDLLYFDELQRLQESERASRAMRLAVAIQTEPGDEEYAMLQRFVGEEPGRIFQARDVDEIRRALQWITFSVGQRAKARDPNDVSVPPPPDLDQLG